MSVINIQEECFNIEMSCIASEQNNFSLFLSESANLHVLNEGEKQSIFSKIKEQIAKIFDNIAMFLDKLVQTAKKKFATFGLKKAKEKFESLKDSTKDITSDSEIELHFNKSEFLTDSQFKNLDLYVLTGIEKIDAGLISTISYVTGHVFYEYIVKNKLSVKEYVMKVFCASLNVSDNGDFKTAQDIVEHNKDNEKIKAKNIKSKLNLVENQIKELDEYLSKDFQKTLTKLLAVRNDCRKQSAKLRALGPSFALEEKRGEKGNMLRLCLSAATAYSNYTHLLTSYMFSNIRVQTSCIKHNISELSKVL